MASSSSDFPLSSASLAQLYSGSNPICPLDPSQSKPAATHINPSHPPVVSLKALYWAHSSSSCIPPHLAILYSPFLSTIVSMRMTPSYSHLILRPLFHLNRAVSLFSKPNISMDVIQPSLSQ